MLHIYYIILSIYYCILFIYFCGQYQHLSEPFDNLFHTAVIEIH